MSLQPPFRMPCEEISGTPRIYLGSPFAHGLAPILLHKFANTTVVPNPAGGADIPPYERWAGDPGSGCGTYFTGNGSPYSSAWPLPQPTNVFTDTGDFVDMAVARKSGFKNVFARRQWHGAFPWTAPEALCPTVYCPANPLLSYQEFQATATQTKYRTVTYDATLNNHFDAGDSAGTSVTGSITGAITVDGNSGVKTSSLLTQIHGVNAGEDPDPITTDIVGGVQTVTDPNIPSTVVTDGVSTYLDDLMDYHCDFPAINLARGISYSPTSLAAWIAEWNSGTFAGADPDSNPFTGAALPEISDPNNYSGSSSGTLDAGVETWTSDLSFSRTATTVTWNFTITQIRSDGSEDNTWSYSGTVTLSDANTAAALKTDMVSLLSWWPLNDDSLYPLRKDLKSGVAPLVSRNEVGTNVNPIGFQIAGWTDPNAAIYDGSILGKPKDAGYQDFFDFNFVDVRGCCFKPGDGSQSWSWYPVGWGQNVSTFNSNTGCQLPLNTTQWNNWFEAINKPPCAFMFYADQSDYYGAGCVSSSGAPSKPGDAGAFVMGKWAEILELWPSQNFAMPAGDAKFWLDETRVYCATNVSGSGAGSVWALIDPTTGLPPTATPEIDDIWGGPVVGGFYALAGWDGTNITLGAKQFDVPSNWKSKSDVGPVTISGVTHSDADFCFGPLRWSDKPSLLGRVAVTTTGPGTTFTFTAAQPAFGMDSSTHQEQVDLFAADMTVLASNVTATRADDTHFTVASGQPTAVWVMIHGAAKWYVNDTAPKGDFSKLDWTADLRTPQEYARLSTATDCDGDPLDLPTANAGGGPPTLPFAEFNQTACCLPFVPCAPKVVCISPNGETFTNGHTYDFPSTFLLDEQYGSKWWGKVEQAMTDVLWQPPHRPCSIESCASWNMDDGSCHAKVPGSCPPGDDSPAPQYFFAHAPQVEARLTVPSSADACGHAYGADQTEAGPGLPAGVQIGWLSPVNYDTGDVAFPPVAPPTDSSTGIPGGADMAWNLHNLLCGACSTFSYSVPGC